MRDVLSFTHDSESLIKDGLCSRIEVLVEDAGEHIELTNAETGLDIDMMSLTDAEQDQIRQRATEEWSNRLQAGEFRYPDRCPIDDDDGVP